MSKLNASVDAAINITLNCMCLVLELHLYTCILIHTTYIPSGAHEKKKSQGLYSMCNQEPITSKTLRHFSWAPDAITKPVLELQLL